MLQPIGITKDKELVFGQRRIETFKLLGRDTIPARIIPIESIARGEHDENECQPNFTVSERVAILQSIGRKQGAGAQDQSADLPNAAEAAKLADFEGERTARNATTAMNTGAPELVEAMDKGEVSIDAAVVIARQPAEEQKAIVALPKQERKKKVAPRTAQAESDADVARINAFARGRRGRHDANPTQTARRRRGDHSALGPR